MIFNKIWKRIRPLFRNILPGVQLPRLLNKLLSESNNMGIIASIFGLVMCGRMGYEVGGKLYSSLNHWRTWVLLILASGLCLFISVTFIKGSYVFSPINDRKINIEAYKVNENYMENCPCEDRHKSSLWNASFVYEHTGEIIKYFDEEGKLINFSPTKNDVEERDTNIQLDKDMILVSRLMLWFGIGFISTYLLFVLFGYMKVKKYTLNQALQPSAKSGTG